MNRPNLEHHRRVPMPERPRYQLDGDAGAEVLDRPVVAAVVQPERRQSECSEPFAVIVGDLPAIHAAEEALARRRRGEMTLDVRPRPIRDVGWSVAAPGPGTTRPKARAAQVTSLSVPARMALISSPAPYALTECGRGGAAEACCGSTDLY